APVGTPPEALAAVHFFLGYELGQSIRNAGPCACREAAHRAACRLLHLQLILAHVSYAHPIGAELRHDSALAAVQRHGLRLRLMPIVLADNEVSTRLYQQHR